MTFPDYPRTFHLLAPLSKLKRKLYVDSVETINVFLLCRNLTEALSFVQHATVKKLFEKYQKFKVVDITRVCVVYKVECVKMPSHDLWLMGHCIVGVWMTACDCVGMILLTV